MSSIELDSVDGLNKFEKTLGKLKSKAQIISTINLPQNSGLMIEENKLESQNDRGPTSFAQKLIITSEPPLTM